ncbi:MAG: histone deacetylase [bacterium]
MRNPSNHAKLEKQTGLIYHPTCLKHDIPHHPERPARITATMEYLKEKEMLNRLSLIEAEPVRDEDLLRTHSEQLVSKVRELSLSGGGYIDADTEVNSYTYEAARLAAGGAVKAAKLVMERTINNAFSLLRPPGHHANRDRAAGFCYFNNLAVMIKYLQARHGLARILVLDWDAHAGNGTEEIFWSDPGVLVISLHQDPRFFYPGTGFIEERGGGDGEGYTVNIPLPPGSGNGDYIYLLKEFVVPLARRYKPEFIAISSGTDSHRDDYISGLSLTEEGFGQMSRQIVELAEAVCSGRMVVCLEGGYNLAALSRSNYFIISALLGELPEYGHGEEPKISTRQLLNTLNNQARWMNLVQPSSS